jgi:LPS-assembly lipoprotein
MMKRNLMVVGLTLLLSACGFHLRGTGDNSFALHEINLKARDAYGATVNEVRSALEGSGVKVHIGAPYSLVLASERENQRTASYTSSARTAEYQLNLAMDYQIQGQDHLPLLTRKLEIQRFYVQDQNNLVGSQQEAEQVKAEMRREMVQQLLQQLASITPERLQELEQEAIAKADAEAQALEAERRARAATPQQSPLQLPLRNQ